VIARAGVLRGSHAGKALRNILATYPRDELFQTSEDDLLRTTTGILHLGERQRFRLFVRRDPFERFLVCLIYSPRETYTTELREKWQAILLAAFNGTSSEFNVHFSESVLARIMITVRTEPGRIPPFDVRELETKLALAARRWDDDLKDALIDAVGEARGNELQRRFAAALPAAYREDFAARAAVPDIEMMARLSPSSPLGMSLYRPLEADPGTLRFKLFHLGGPVTLSDSQPMLKRMGLKVLDERPYRIAPPDQPPVWLHDFGMQTKPPTPTSTSTSCTRCSRMPSRASSAAKSRTTISTGWWSPRASRRRDRRAARVCEVHAPDRLSAVGAFIESTLAAHPEIARHLVALYRARFDPEATAGDADAEARLEEIQSALEGVENLSEDRVLRQMLALILATTRTNFWRRDAQGGARTFLSFKFDPSKVRGSRAQADVRDLRLFAALRGRSSALRPVARGGLRWSDRPEDFRTEILGLVKAQQVKNIVIVPVGSKGGFVLKRAPSPSDRDAYMKEGIACYQDYLRALLDLTDNRVGDKVVPPPQVRGTTRRPYLVVAADKGPRRSPTMRTRSARSTDSGSATRSPPAARSATTTRRWASRRAARGSRSSAISARWGSTRRRPTSPSRHRRHVGRRVRQRHAAVEAHQAGRGVRPPAHLPRPDPGPGSSFAERRAPVQAAALVVGRLRCEAHLAGGGVYPRSAKSIAITPEVKAALAIAADALTPTELVNAILKAPVDLLYNGGIGTYVKARSETHAQVGDRANDALRVDGRSSAARSWRRAATSAARSWDASSSRARAADQHGRDRQLGRRRHVRPRSEHQDPARPRHRRRRAHREAAQHAARGDDRRRRGAGAARQLLPDAGAVGHRPHRARAPGCAAALRPLPGARRPPRAGHRVPADRRGVHRAAHARARAHEPERAVMLAYAKMWLYDELLASTLPDDPWVATALARYFPARSRSATRATWSGIR
jgi:glutamate dehydrogenase